MFRIVFSAARSAEAEIIGDLETARPLHIDLCLIFRRGLVAACCGALEAQEEIRNARAGIAGEVTALHTLQGMASENRRVAILSLSLVNRDIRSHFTGNDLQHLPAMILGRLQELLRPQDLVFAGREGEWLLLLPDVESKVQPSLAAAQITRAFVDPLRLGQGRPISMAVAIGAALCPDHGRDALSAIQSARLARWALGGNSERFSWFRPEQNEDWQRYSQLVEELRQAMEFEQLELHLQPQVDLASEACIGAELLLRWQRRSGEWIAPPQIVEMIEQNGWRELFTDWLIRAAMRTSEKLTAAGIKLTLSINLTAGDLLDPDLPELLDLSLKAWDIPGTRFILELTESAMMGDRELGMAAIERLRGMGFQMSLDDFGTGYSSLSYLVSLPIHELKVDRSFVIAMFQSEENMRIVRTIIELAKDLGMVSLAEGIDEPRQLEQLRQLGCKVGQGYLFAKPMALPDFVAWFKGRRN
jgi:EAL domain-containing protein (putative c-di-GMP-specific phosphodiesterase class I)